MNVFLISLLIATLAVASFANVVPSNVDEKNLLDESAALEAANLTTSAQNATTLDVNEALVELFETYKNVMRCGNDTLGLPPIAPFRQPYVNINFTKEHLAIKGDIKNLVIAGLDDYLMMELAYNASTNRTVIDMLYKDIQIVGKFNLTVEADLAGFRYTQPLEGFMNLQVLNLRKTISLNIGPNETGSIHVSNLEYSLQVGDIVVNNLNTEWGVVVNNFANQYIQIYLEAATQMANKVFYNVPYSYLGPSIVEYIKLLKSMDCNQ